MTDLDLFAQADAARDAAIAQAEASVAGDPVAAHLAQRVTALLMQRLHEENRREFTADEVSGLLDTLGAATDQATRKRLVGTVINRGKGKAWTAVGFTKSTRRHSAPITVWRTL